MVDDRHVLCHERVRFVGDAVAVVAAETIEATEAALELIEVEYEELPALFDAEEAMKLGATDYAVKPLDLGVISLKFSNILEKRGQKISKI